MKARHFSAGVLFGALVSIALGVLAQSGGYPTLARFARIGIGAGPSTNPAALLTMTNAAPLALMNGTGSTGFGSYRLQRGGASRGWYGLALGASGCVTGDAQDDTCIVSTSGTIRLSADAAASTSFGVSSTAITGTGGVDMTPATTTSTATVVGCTTSPTTTVRLVKIGNMVTASIDAVACTSNATTMSLTSAIPAAFQSARNLNNCGLVLTDNSVNVQGCAVLASGSTTLTLTRPGAAFTGSGLKGLNDVTFSWNRT